MSVAEDQVVVWILSVGALGAALFGILASRMAHDRLATFFFGLGIGAGGGVIVSALTGVVVGFLVEVYGSPGFIQAIELGLLGFILGIPAGIAGGVCAGLVALLIRR